MKQRGHLQWRTRTKNHIELGSEASNLAWWIYTSSSCGSCWSQRNLQSAVAPAMWVQVFVLSLSEHDTCVRARDVMFSEGEICHSRPARDSRSQASRVCCRSQQVLWNHVLWRCETGSETQIWPKKRALFKTNSSCQNEFYSNMHWHKLEKSGKGVRICIPWILSHRNISGISAWNLP